MYYCQQPFEKYSGTYMVQCLANQPGRSTICHITYEGPSGKGTQHYWIRKVCQCWCVFICNKRLVGKAIVWALSGKQTVVRCNNYNKTHVLSSIERYLIAIIS